MTARIVHEVSFNDPTGKYVIPPFLILGEPTPSHVATNAHPYLRRAQKGWTVQPGTLTIILRDGKEIAVTVARQQKRGTR